MVAADAVLDQVCDALTQPLAALGAGAMERREVAATAEADAAVEARMGAVEEETADLQEQILDQAQKAVAQASSPEQRSRILQAAQEAMKVRAV